MSSHNNNFTFSPNINFGVDNFFNDDVFSHRVPEVGAPIPPPAGYFNQLSGPPIMLLDGGFFDLL